MAGVGMKFDKRFFFDRKAVADIVGKKAAKNLSKAGAFVRTKARQSMRRRKKASAPGSPPSAHSKDAKATLKNIQFAFDPARLSIFVGPELLNVKYPVPVPGLLERGGTTTLNQSRIIPREFLRIGLHRSIKKEKNEWRTVSQGRINIRNRRQTRNGKPFFEFRKVQATYAARPFMGPALVAEAPKFPSLFGRSA